ncbi:aldo/keto reductase [Oceanobacillus locisalsi]|uniref:Aldo/keto reductase n=1 Tax=Oceanobacillus locisalsi TaxID=546107 RepID=A0ABW3NG29_9BACI
MILNENYQLSNGIEIPKLGLGTWFIDNEDAAHAVIETVKIGYRHIDTAQAYGNENGIGEGVKNSGVGREDLFITTKLAAEEKSYEEAYRAGKLRAIGVSNFEKEDLDNILDYCKVKPMVNQILAHISNTPFDLIAYTQEQGILVEAYSPIAHGELFKNKEVETVAEKYNVSIPQLSIRYTLQLGLLPLPKTANPAHMKNNAGVDFTISEEDMEDLKKAERIENYGEANDMPVFGWKLKK